jgi:NAD(P)-dependent dehydrogenase (short-subunit alcohol dehydrogenase family)
MAFFEGKVAVVTGAAQGLGEAYARALAAEGADGAVCDVRSPITAVAADIAKTTGRKVRGYICDVSRGEAVRAFADLVLRDFGGVDVLVLNAGIYMATPVDAPREEALADYERVMNTNVKGVYLCERAFVGSLVARGGGDIVIISTDHVLPPISAGQTRQSPRTDLYDASKWALNGFVQAWALGLKGKNIRVNGIAMGATDTPMLRGIFPGGQPPAEVAKGWMTPAQQGQLLIDLIKDGRTGDLIASVPGRPVVLPARSGRGQPVSQLAARQFHHRMMESGG